MFSHSKTGGFLRVAGAVMSLVALACAAASAAPTVAPAGYTPAQARTGKTLFDQNCAKCHGATLSGGSAPNLTGPAFTASGLSFHGLHTAIADNMPLDKPGALKPDEYAAIIAYVLAVNCYAAGTVAYPATGTVANPKEKVGMQGSKPCALPSP